MASNNFHYFLVFPLESMDFLPPIAYGNLNAKECGNLNAKECENLNAREIHCVLYVCYHAMFDYKLKKDAHNYKGIWSCSTRD